MIFLTACKDNVKNLDMQAERQETTFRFRFFPLPLAHPDLRPGTLRIVPPPSRLSVVARHVGFRVPMHGGRAPASPERHRQETVACRAACPRTWGCDIFGIARWRSFPFFLLPLQSEQLYKPSIQKENETDIIASCGRNGKPLRRAEAARRTGTQR